MNRGKGAAVKHGMLAATGRYQLFFDADGSTPIEMLDRAWEPLEKGADVVIGSRAIPGAYIAVRQPWHRRQMGRINNRLLKALGLTQFRDTQCGFKIFTAEASKQVFPLQRVERFSFDAEILYIAQRKHLRIEQVPVNWLNSPDTRVDAIRDAVRMVWDVLLIRSRAWLGYYD